MPMKTLHSQIQSFIHSFIKQQQHSLWSSLHVTYKMYIRSDILRFMSMLIKTVPRITPHREELIIHDIQKYASSTTNSKELYVDVKEINLNGDDNIFKPSVEIIAKCINNLPRLYEDIDFKGMGIRILLRNLIICCDRKLRIDHRHSSITIYSDEGLQECLNFHGTCNVCKQKYYYNYTEDKDNNRFFTDVQVKDYFVISRTTWVL